MQEEFLCFELAGERYVHPVVDIREIIVYQTPVPVPGAPESVEGVLHVRGDIITVVSGLALFGQHERAVDEGWRTIVFELGDISFGLSVDKVVKMLSLERDEIQPAAQSESPVISGTVRDEEQLFIAFAAKEVLELLGGQ